jgi:hypothetical protein
MNIKQNLGDVIVKVAVSGSPRIPIHNWLLLWMLNNDDIIATLALVFYFIISTFPEKNVQMKVKYTLNFSTFSAATVAAIAIVVFIAIVVLVAVVVVIAKVVSEAVAAKAVAEGSIPSNTFLKSKI